MLTKPTVALSLFPVIFGLLVNFNERLEALEGAADAE